MSYLRCSGTITRAEEAEQLWLDARAVAQCDFDLSGRMNGR
jgi:hypothetical protein